MNERSNAWWLAKFEMKAQLKGIFWMLFLLVFLTMFFVTALPMYLAEGVGATFFDLAFIVVFGMAVAWIKPKEFQYQKIGDEIWGSPFFIALNQLPITKNELVNSRYIIFFSYTLPYYISTLAIIYIFTPELREAASIPEYLTFSALWISIGSSFGLTFAVSDSGDKVTNKQMWLYGIGLTVGAVVFFTLEHLFLETGIVAWTLAMSVKWPLVVLLFAIVSFLLSIKLWKVYMIRQIDKMDYLK